MAQQALDWTRRHPIAPWVISDRAAVDRNVRAAIALLAQDGKLSIDDPVRKYIPEVPDFGTQYESYSGPGPDRIPVTALFFAAR